MTPPRILDDPIANRIGEPAAFLMAVQRLVEYRLKRLKSPDARRLLLLMMNALIDGYQGTLLSVESEHRFEWDAHIGNLLTIAYYLGSFCPAPLSRSASPNFQGNFKAKDKE
jgi:hypothetical protein